MSHLRCIEGSIVVAMELKTVLAKVARQMGYTENRPKQEEVILDCIHGSDVYVSLPTGGASPCVTARLLSGVFIEALFTNSSRTGLCLSTVVAHVYDSVLLVQQCVVCSITTRMWALLRYTPTCNYIRTTVPLQTYTNMYSVVIYQVHKDSGSGGSIH